MLSKIKQDLNDTEITSICNNIYYYIKPEEEICPTYIEYRILSDTDKDFAGNTNMTELYSIQIDIFSYGDYIELAKTIKKVLKAKGYLYLSGDGDFYEPDTRLYHKAMRFKYKLFV